MTTKSLWTTTILFLAGAGFPIGATTANPGGAPVPRPAQEQEGGCVTCKELERIEALFRSGKLDALELIDRKLELAEIEYLNQRLSLVEAKMKLLEARVRAGTADELLLFDSTLEVQWLRFSLKKTDKEKFDKERSRVVQAYAAALKKRFEQGTMRAEEYQKRRKALGVTD